jgi:uncharacterized RDD family membrane protein YckC
VETSLEQIKQAIAQGNTERARQLLREELRSNPSADAYYLGAQVALDAAQKREFLEKAVELDPFHAAAHEQLTALKSHPASAVTRQDLAPISMRLTAYVIDAFILSVASQTIFRMLALYGIVPPPSASDYVRLTSRQGYYPAQLLASTLVYLGVSVAYNLYFLTRQNGQTPGKYLRKIRVVSLTGEAITYRQALIRNELGYLLSTTFLFLGFFWAFFDKNRQTWHDKLANTIVIRKYPDR